MLKVFLIVLSACVGGASIASGAQAQARPRVVFINPGKVGESFWDLFSKTMRAAGDQLNIDVEILNAERNYQTMRKLGLEVVARANPPDFLILSNEETAATPVVEAADKAGIKTFLASNAFSRADAIRYGKPRQVFENWIGSLLPDMRAAGSRMARSLVETARLRQKRGNDGKFHFLMIGGDERTPNSIDRTDGAKEEFARYDDVVVDRILYANWSAAEAKQLMARYLEWAGRSTITPAGVWAASDSMALAALAVAEESGLKGGRDIDFVGLNWTPEAIVRVQDGAMLLTDGGHFFGGAWSMVLLRDYADGCDFAKTASDQIFPLSALDKSNLPSIADLIVAQAFDKIRYRDFLAARRGVCGKYNFSLEAISAAYVR